MELAQLSQMLIDGLTRKASQKCSIWAENYVVYGMPVPGPCRFRRHPWSKEMHDEAGDWDGMKAAQMGYSAVALHRAIYSIDILKVSVLYVLPKRNPDATDFSVSKFEPLLENSTHLSLLFNKTRNVGLKRAGDVSLFVRGSRSRSGLKSISAGTRVYDEFDEMNQDNITLADERSSGFDAINRQNIRLSTPTIPRYGIHKELHLTTEDHFHFKCPHCSRYTELLFPSSLVLETDSISDISGIKKSWIKCHLCNGRLEHEDKPNFLSVEGPNPNALWVPTRPRSTVERRSFLINQLYSTVEPPSSIARAILKGRLSQADEQEAYNSKGGLPHEVAGARVTDTMIANCTGNHSIADVPKGTAFRTMGVDVGHKTLQVVIDEWLIPQSFGTDVNLEAKCRNLWHGYIPGFLGLKTLLYNYKILHTVVDIFPDYRGALNFAYQFLGQVSLSQFTENTGKPMRKTPDGIELKVNRTYWLDCAQGRFLNKTISIPRDTISDFKEHIKALIRKPEKDKNGNPTAKYITTGTSKSSSVADHFGLARAYSEMALPLALSRSQNRDIGDFF